MRLGSNSRTSFRLLMVCSVVSKSIGRGVHGHAFHSICVREALSTKELTQDASVHMRVARDDMDQLFLHECVEFGKGMPGNGGIGVMLGVIRHIPHQVAHEAVRLRRPRSIQYAPVVWEPAVLRGEEGGEDAMAQKLRQQDAQQARAAEDAWHDPGCVDQKADPRLPLNASDHIQF